VKLTTADKINRALVDANFAEQFYGIKNVLPSTSTAQKQSQSVKSSCEVPLPCTINTFGYGSDHDPALLKNISEKANGLYFYIEKPDEIPKAFADCLGGLLSTVAQKYYNKN